MADYLLEWTVRHLDLIANLPDAHIDKGRRPPAPAEETDFAAVGARVW
ncbi:hypothetical protein [Mycolicibacterium goodii]|nr:hypothetical protein [Mycolicibacterium goodii]MBU8830742.1 hypothetical protein [Mycolicibacterium goodii]